MADTSPLFFSKVDSPEDYKRKVLQVGRDVSLFTVLNFGIASQLRPNRPLLLIFINVFYDGRGFLAAG